MALAFGGYGTGITVNTEAWDGTSWTEVNNLASARSDIGGTGTATEALAFGGVTSPVAGGNLTEEFTAPDVVIKTITTS